MIIDNSTLLYPILSLSFNPINEYFQQKHTERLSPNNSNKYRISNKVNTVLREVCQQTKKHLRQALSGTPSPVAKESYLGRNDIKLCH